MSLACSALQEKQQLGLVLSLAQVHYVSVNEQLKPSAPNSSSLKRNEKVTRHSRPPVHQTLHLPSTAM